VDLIATFRAYFGNEYGSLKLAVVSLRQRLSQSLGEVTLLEIQRALDANTAAIEFWKQFVSIPNAPSLAFDNDILPALSCLRESALTLVDQKEASLLESCVANTAFLAAIGRIQELAVAVTAYNSFVTETNTTITAKKQSLNAANVQSARSSLSLLKARKIRFESPTAENCVLYREQQKQKKLLETEKEKAKKALDDFGKNVCGEYEQRINELLDRFHAGFRICDTSRRYIGGTASTSYQIVINNVAVDLGDNKTPTSTHSFKNTLSSGDRSTLAFAFFVAQVERDPTLGGKIIVLDDPFTSQDRSRRSCTQQIINRLATQAKQILVLSHDASFLRDIWDSDYTQDIKRFSLSGSKAQRFFPSGISPTTRWAITIECTVSFRSTFTKVVGISDTSLKRSVRFWNTG